MKIGIDVSPIIYGTGVSLYTKNLVETLLEGDKENDYTLFGYSLRRRGIFKETFGSKVKTFPFPPTIMDFVWNQLHILPVEWLTGRLDVFHSSDWTQPPSSAFKVTTIHDLVPLRFPNISHPKIVETHKARLHWVAKEVDRIIAVSEFTKREIVDILGISPEKIRVIYEAPDPRIKRQIKTKEVLARLNVPENYLLAVGADPRKNISVIIQAVNKVNLKLKLVVVGKPWEQRAQVPNVQWLGHISSEDLNALYVGAQALVYTSLYEGFGLPILDAMQVGCPVVTSNVSSMPEAAGDAAVLVNPHEPEDIAKGIEKVLSNRELWIKKGLARAKQFSWEETARQTLEVYEEVQL